MAELNAASTYGFGTLPTASPLSFNSLPANNTTSIPGTGISAHLSAPLFWLLVLALVLLGIIGFSISGKVKGVGKAGFSLK